MAEDIPLEASQTRIIVKAEFTLRHGVSLIGRQAKQMRSDGIVFRNPAAYRIGHSEPGLAHGMSLIGG
jgi:hypothetical protein